MDYPARPGEYNCPQGYHNLKKEKLLFHCCLNCTFDKVCLGLWFGLILTGDLWNITCWWILEIFSNMRFCYHDGSITLK